MMEGGIFKAVLMILIIAVVIRLLFKATKFVIRLILVITLLAAIAYYALPYLGLI